MNRFANGRFLKRRGKKIATRLQPLLSCTALVLACLFQPPQASAIDRATTRPPRDWAVETAVHEVEILRHPGSYLRYRMHIIDQKGDQVRDVIESRDGAVARLVLRDGRALTPEEDTAERDRLNGLMTSPGAFAHHIKNDISGKKLAADLVGMMPDAMIYSYAPGQPQIGRDKGAGEVVLDYSPNPKWSPPSTTAEALTGLEGRMWIDIKTQRMLRMEGRVFRSVNFGWGMLAHIYPGGRLELEQTDAGDGRWIYTHFKQDVSVRALMVKTLNVRTQVDASSFQAIPSALGYQDAIRVLLASPLPAR